MNKNIMPRNKYGEPHGYWEVYLDGTLWYKGNYINGRQDGYWEGVYSCRELRWKRYNIEI